MSFFPKPAEVLQRERSSRQPEGLLQKDETSG
jgi:hypothetical protein